MTTAEHDPAYPFPGSSYRGPAPRFTELRARCPVVRVRTSGGTPAWLVTRHADIAAVLADDRLSRAASYAPGAPKFSGLFQAPPEMIVSLDPPDHTRLRALADQGFSARRVADMRPQVEHVVATLLDGLERRGDEPVDLVEDFASPLALTTICLLLGVPEADRADFRTWIRQFADVQGPEEAAVEGREKLGAYIAGLVAAKQRDPGDDVLSDLISARLGDDRLGDDRLGDDRLGDDRLGDDRLGDDRLGDDRLGDDRLGFDELVGLGYTLLGGGYDSAAGQIANFVLTLLAHHPEQWRLLGQRPDAVPGTVEELLRCVNLNATDDSGLPRIATRDIELGGTTIPEGDAVFLAFASANRDESVFPHADRVDFERTEVPHMAFGHGIHHCLGADLARIELAVAIGELTRRYPDARLAVPEREVRWRTGDVNHNPVSLPVRLGRPAHPGPPPASPAAPGTAGDTRK